MHSALLIPEIVLEILEWLEEKKSDQLHLGLCCRNFWQCAKAVIWRCILGGGRPLLYLLPDDIVVTKWESESAVGLSRPVTEAEWQPLLNYGSFIQTLSLRDQQVSGAPYAACHLALFVMATYKGTTPLFPNLQDLHLNLFFPNGIMGSIPLVKRSLKKLSLSITNPEWNGFFEIVNRLFLAIERGTKEVEIMDISLTGNVYPWPEKATVTNTEFNFGYLVRQHTNIRTLTFADIHDGSLLFPLLAALPLLESLKISLSWNTEPIGPYQLPSNAFPRLHTLIIGSKDSLYNADYANLLRAISSTSLVNFRFTTRDAKTVHDTLQVLGEKYSSSLSDLTISFLPYPNERGTEVAFDSLTPLKACRGLKKLMMHGDLYMRLSDDCIRVVAEAWPHLQTLWLTPRLEMDAIPLVTPRSFQILATELPDLIHLALSVDFGPTGSPLDSEVSAASASGLLHLDCAFVEMCTST